MSRNNSNNKKIGTYSDDWKSHKDDLLVWRRFWALWELRRKWKWADWFYQGLDRTDGEILAPEAWTLFPGQRYMKLCLWVALVRTVHEGLTENLDPLDTSKNQRVSVSTVFSGVPPRIRNFPAIKGSPFRDFRNAIFHCQWSPTLGKLNIDQTTTNAVEALHKDLGEWLNAEFRASFEEFEKHYSVPDYWVYAPDGNEFMPQSFY
jgi:hypothetical protein